MTKKQERRIPYTFRDSNGKEFHGTQIITGTRVLHLAVEYKGKIKHCDKRLKPNEKMHINYQTKMLFIYLLSDEKNKQEF